MQERPTFAPSRFFNRLALMPPELRPVVKKRRTWRRRKGTKAKQSPKPRRTKGSRA